MRNIKQHVLTIIMIVSNLCSFGQERGIYFEPVSENMGVIVAKAKAENKLIFIDCYATWCGPCKTMDNEVYSDPKVGEFINKHFISVRLQMDKTPMDSKDIREWSHFAGSLAEDYTITAYPCMMVFSSDFKPLHKMIGAKLPAENFLQGMRDALEPEKQYYTILKNYQPGKIDTTELKGLANAVSYDDGLAAKLALDYLKRIPKSQLFTFDNITFASKFNHDDQVNAYIASIVKTYQDKDFQNITRERLLAAFNQQPYTQQAAKHYLTKLKDNELEAESNLSLLIDFQKLIQLHDRYFDFFYRDSTKADKIIGKTGISKNIVDWVIGRQIIQPFLAKYDSAQTDADWARLEQIIETETDIVTAKRAVDNARYSFYATELGKAESHNSEKKFYWGKKRASAIYHRISDNVVSQLPDNIDDFGKEAYLNNNAWIIFTYSDDKNELEKALFWATKSETMSKSKNATCLDTKANLLYKLGFREKALALELKATELNPGNIEIAQAYETMKSGRPTWPIVQ